MAAAPHDNELSTTDRSASGVGNELRFRFAPPRLYPLALDAIGQGFQSRIGSVTIEVCVPESPPHAIEPTTGSSALVQDVRRSRWIVPRSLELTVPAGTDPDDPTFGSALRRWWTLTTDWLAAWVGEPPGGDVPMPILVQPLDAGVSETPTLGGFMMFYGLAGEAHASSAQFARALQLAGEDAELPLAYILLLRAQSADTVAEHRVAVMEACSAAEVAAGSAIERALTTFGCPAAFADGVVRRARGIRFAHGVLVELNVPCASRRRTSPSLRSCATRRPTVQATSTRRRRVGWSESHEHWSQPSWGPRHQSDENSGRVACSPPRWAAPRTLNSSVPVGLGPAPNGRTSSQISSPNSLILFEATPPKTLENRANAAYKHPGLLNHNPKVAGSNPAPAMRRSPALAGFFS
jgi:hypothetical protein